MHKDVLLAIVSSFGWTLLGVLVLFVGTLLWDRLDPVDYRAEIAKGNVAAAIKFAAVILSLAAIVVAVLTT
ncbi:MAG: DUF350 domain-containing protein [bacterium]|jgi:uncharacterized membrane protein YjfL (UPF0719 family)|nr:DUF350 domain-containing protein [bacterium]